MGAARPHTPPAGHDALHLIDCSDSGNAGIGTSMFLPRSSCADCRRPGGERGNAMNFTRTIQGQAWETCKMTLTRTSCAGFALARKKRGFCFARAARLAAVLAAKGETQ